MAESFTASQVDSRTFGDQQARLLTDLNRPNLLNIVPNYLQDAMRFYARKAFFFNDTDNTPLSDWAAATTYPQGSTIQTTIGGTQYIVIALNEGLSGGSIPTFPTTLFTVPAAPAVPPPASGTAGTVDDNGGPPTGIRWATVALQAQPTIWTQLSTVYMTNTYDTPIDYVAPRLVEVTWSGNLRMAMARVSYEELRAYDVIRPTPPTTYPTMWAWFQEDLYFWPYPVSFYPITLSYRTAPAIPIAAAISNFWTTKAEALVRFYANYLIQMNLIHDEAAAQSALKLANEQEQALRSQMISQDQAGITPEPW